MTNSKNCKIHRVQHQPLSHYPKKKAVKKKSSTTLTNIPHSHNELQATLDQPPDKAVCDLGFSKATGHNLVYLHGERYFYLIQE